MRKYKKYTFDFVKQFIEKDGQCKLLDTEYKNTKTKLKCKCLKCNNIFYRNFESFKSGTYKYCEHCCKGMASQRLRFDYEYVKEYIEINTKCKLLSTEYNNNNDNLILQCECGEIFQTSFCLIKKGKVKCNKCNGLARLTYNEVKHYIEENSNCTLVSKKYKGVHDEITLRCKCGNIFKTTFRNFRDRNAKACRECRRIKSGLEFNVSNILDNLNIKYIEQFVFDDCIGIGGKCLLFDFYLPEYNLLIEVDGEQHFTQRAFNRSNEEFGEGLYNDATKNSYCEDNNINLLRIPYWDIKKSKSLILDKIC